MKYSIVFTKSAMKELVKMPDDDVRKVVAKIDLLAENPRPQGAIKLKGGLDLYWRIRVGDFRIIYSIEDIIKVVEIIAVGHRKDVY